jgi:hypothetical protein
VAGGFVPGLLDAFYSDAVERSVRDGLQYGRGYDFGISCGLI